MENIEPKPGYLGPNLEGHKEPVPAMAWEQIEAGLNKRKRRGFLFWLWGGMGVLLVGLGLWFTQNQAIEPTQTALHQPAEETKVPKTVESKTAGSNVLPQARHVETDKEMKPEVEPEAEKPQTVASTNPGNEPVAKSPPPQDVASESTPKAAHPKNHVVKHHRKQHAKENGNGIAKASLAVAEPVLISPPKEKTLVKTSSETGMQTEAETPVKSVSVHSQKVEEVVAIEKSSKAEIVKPEKETQEPAHQEVAVIEKPANEKKEAQPEAGNQPGKQEEAKDKKATTEPVIYPVALSQTKPNEAMAAVAKADSTRKPVPTDSVQKKEKPLVAGDSLKKKDYTTQLKVWHPEHFWMVSLNAGIMQQTGNLQQDYFNNQGKPLVSTTPSNISIAPSIRLAFSRLWQITQGFWIGLEASANGILQKTQANLNPSEESPIRYRYGPDSLSFFAETDYRNQQETFTRKTWIAGLFPKFQWKPGSWPIGLQGRIGLASFTGWDEANKSLSNPSNSFEFAYNNSEFGLWVPLKKKGQVSVDFNRLNWSQQSLAIPVSNKGKNWIISIGYGWKW